jgi:hypothetical protein
MNLMELLLAVDGRLRPLVGADDATLHSVLDEVAVGPRAPGVPPEASPEGVLAGQLLSIEVECHMLLDMLRDKLGVELTAVAEIEVTGSVTGPVPSDPPNGTT